MSLYEIQGTLIERVQRHTGLGGALHVYLRGQPQLLPDRHTVAKPPIWPIADASPAFSFEAPNQQHLT